MKSANTLCIFGVRINRPAHFNLFSTKPAGIPSYAKDMLTSRCLTYKFLTLLEPAQHLEVHQFDQLLVDCKPISAEMVDEFLPVVLLFVIEV